MGQRDPRIDAYIDGAAGFARPILVHLRELVHAACPDCVETLKWSAPSFTYRGKILCGMAAFRQHAAFGLWQGDRIVGRESDGAGSSGSDKAETAMGQFGRLKRVADLPGKRVLTGYLREAMQLIDGGVTRSPGRSAPRPPAEVPADLAAALRAHAGARKTFAEFPPGCRREYIEWITEAKREATRAKRVAQTIEWLAEGKRRNWKYEQR